MTFKELLNAVPGTVAALGAAIAALSATLVKQELIPENLAIVGVVASLLVVLAVIFGSVRRAAMKRRTLGLVVAATVCLVVLMVVQLTWVVTVDPYGPDRGAHRFLIGSSLTAEGLEMKQAVGGLHSASFVAAIGHAEIPAAYGGSFAVLAAAYTLAYFGFLVGVVLSLIGLVRKEPVKRAPTEG